MDVHLHGGSSIDLQNLHVTSNDKKRQRLPNPHFFSIPYDCFNVIFEYSICPVTAMSVYTTCKFFRQFLQSEIFYGFPHVVFVLKRCLIPLPPKASIAFVRRLKIGDCISTAGHLGMYLNLFSKIVALDARYTNVDDKNLENLHLKELNIGACKWIRGSCFEDKPLSKTLKKLYIGKSNKFIHRGQMKFTLELDSLLSVGEYKRGRYSHLSFPFGRLLLMGNITELNFKNSRIIETAQLGKSDFADFFGKLKVLKLGNPTCLTNCMLRCLVSIEVLDIGPFLESSDEMNENLGRDLTVDAFSQMRKLVHLEVEKMFGISHEILDVLPSLKRINAKSTNREFIKKALSLNLDLIKACRCNWHHPDSNKKYKSFRFPGNEPNHQWCKDCVGEKIQRCRRCAQGTLPTDNAPISFENLYPDCESLFCLKCHTVEKTCSLCFEGCPPGKVLTKMERCKQCKIGTLCSTCRKSSFFVQCELCRNSFCRDCTGNCARCKKVFCSIRCNSVQNCQHGCEPFIDTTNNPEICFRCAEKPIMRCSCCTNENTTVCHLCSTTCHYCKELVCREDQFSLDFQRSKCLYFCSGCLRTGCRKCLGNSSECPKCEKNLCEDCSELEPQVICRECGILQCDDCCKKGSMKCESCDIFYCSNCSKSCMECCKTMCIECDCVSKKCVECEVRTDLCNSCSEERLSVGSLSGSLCYYDSWTCEKCEDKYCENCSTKNICQCSFCRRRIIECVSCFNMMEMCVTCQVENCDDCSVELFQKCKRCLPVSSSTECRKCHKKYCAGCKPKHHGITCPHQTVGSFEDMSPPSTKKTWTCNECLGFCEQCGNKKCECNKCVDMFRKCGCIGKVLRNISIRKKNKQ